MNIFIKLFFLFFMALESFAAIPVERYLFAVGANDGGKSRPRLRYAESDAEAFSKVLVEMGGVNAKNGVILREPSLASMKRGFENLDRKLSEKSNARKEVLFYYSGHADERGLRIGNELYAWADLRRRIDALSADVKISVIDACGSGAITRVKGGVAVPAFMVDASSDMKGYAFITSSTEEESSQESDRLRGSFFTKSLVTGLRGAGDVSGDGKVTLSEAYQFAFNETLEKTQATLGGVQHPSRDMNLAGTGDVVMTDVRSTSAGLVLGEGVDGRVFVRDASGALVVELRKNRGRSLEIGLAPGVYKVLVERPSMALASSVTLANGKRTKLDSNNFSEVTLEKTVVRGETKTHSGLDSLSKYGKGRFSFNLFDTEKKPRKGVQMAVLMTKADEDLLGSQLSLLGNIAKEDVQGFQGSAGFNYAGYIRGTQISAILNLTDSFEGAQLGIFNVASEKSSGLQASTLNVIGDTLTGGQVGVVNIAVLTTVAQAGVANFSKASPIQVGVLNAVGVADIQVGSFNIAKESPIQIGVADVAKSADVQVGAFNMSKANFFGIGVLNLTDSSGMQMGVFNIAKSSHRRQVGIVNICKTCEETPLGLLNFVGNGVWSASSFVDETGSLAVNLHLGTAYFFTALEQARSFDRDKPFREFSDDNRSGIGFGTQFGSYGSHFDLEYMFLPNFKDWKTKRIGSVGVDVNSDDDVDYMHRLRLGATFKAFNGLGLIGGISANVVTEGTDPGVHVAPKGNYHAEWNIAGRDVRVWPGIYAGIVVGKF